MPALLGAVVVLFSACGGDDSDTAARSGALEASVSDYTGADDSDYARANEGDGMAPASEEPAEESPMSDDSADAQSSGAAFSDEETALAAPTVIARVDLGREIVYRATIRVEAEDVTAASREAVAIVEGFGGVVFAQSTEIEPQPRVEMTFKVLPADFSPALESLADVGELVEQSISADDVTERVVDIESRITTAEASVVRLRRLLEEAAGLEDVAQIERELLNRETTLETLRGQLRTLRDQIDLATITLTINQSPDVLPEAGILVGAWVSDEAVDACLGSQDLAVGPDSTVYFCLEVENVGAAALTDVTVSSEHVRLDVGAFEALRGDFDRIDPGELLVAVLAEPVKDARLAGRAATRGLEIGLEVDAVPLDSEGEALPEVSGISFVWVRASSDDSLPGFLDSVVEGARFLRSILSVALVGAGWLVPYLPFIVIAALVWWVLWRRPRRGRTPAERTPAEEAATVPSESSEASTPTPAEAPADD